MFLYLEISNEQIELRRTGTWNEIQHVTMENCRLSYCFDQLQVIAASLKFLLSGLK